MVSAVSQSWSHVFSNPWQFAIGVYVVMGLLVVGFISVRGSKRRERPTGGVLWDEKDNTRNALFYFLAIGKFHPIGVFLEIALWPVWLACILIFWRRNERRSNHLTKR